MNEFKKNNPEIGDTMKTHLIDDLTAFGIWANDYRAFIEKRGERVLKEISNRLLIQTTASS